MKVPTRQILRKPRHISVEEYGQSPEVEAIIDRLKQLSGGPVELDTVNRTL